MKRHFLNLVLFVLAGTVVAIVVAILVPLIAQDHMYSRSNVWLDQDHHVGWRMSVTTGQQWIDVDRHPVAPVPPDNRLVRRGLEIPDDVHEAIGFRARIVNGGVRSIPSWAELSDMQPDYPAVAVAQGWPWQSLYHHRMLTMPVGTHGWIALWPQAAHRYQPPHREIGIPIFIRWPQMIANCLFYTAILWLPFAGFRFARRRIRARRGQCPACAYPIGASNVCTECGKPVTPRPLIE